MFVPANATQADLEKKQKVMRYDEGISIVLLAIALHTLVNFSVIID